MSGVTVGGDGPTADAREHAGRRSFAAGLRQHHPLVFVAAVLLLVPVLLAFQAFFVSGAWMAIPLEYWVSSTNDPYTVVSWRTMELKHEPPEEPLVVLIGGSSARDSIWDGEGLAADIAAAGGPELQAQSLCGMHQTLGGSVAIVGTTCRTPHRRRC